MLPKYTVTENEKNGTYIIRLDDGEFNGIEYRYGEVAFDADEEGLLHFNYFVEQDEFGELGDSDAEKRFHQCIGDILTDLITKAIDNNEVVCAGGT